MCAITQTPRIISSTLAVPVLSEFISRHQDLSAKHLLVPSAGFKTGHSQGECAKCTTSLDRRRSATNSWPPCRAKSTGVCSPIWNPSPDDARRDPLRGDEGRRPSPKRGDDPLRARSGDCPRQGQAGGVRLRVLRDGQSRVRAYRADLEGMRWQRCAPLFSTA